MYHQPLVSASGLKPLVMGDLKELYNALSGCSREEIVLIIMKLMKENKIGYQDITTAYTKWLEYLKENVSEDYEQLKGHVITMWCEGEKNMVKNLKDTMHHLVDKKRINETHEGINSKF